MLETSGRKIQDTKTKNPTPVSQRENVRAYKRRYHTENREKILEKVRNNYRQNREKRLTYGKKWRTENAEKMRSYKIKSNLKLRLEVFAAYGGAFCVCCGEATQQFLSIDHINGDGSRHRRSLKSSGGKDFYRWLRLNNYPPGFQVLCFNCNMAKGILGACPHKTK